MNDNRPAPQPSTDFREAVIAADDTGMIRSEQIVVATEIDESIDPSNPQPPDR